ncbi:hypothetical protein [Burkholderia cenocepacia]|uniref:hypothetical protein n=1 Tax=Burkholderia cenocepacia TaxID=95486 RepID=UPI002AB7B2C7|nr:hypothetical protein [Burkholderia cenocepacia]
MDWNQTHLKMMWNRITAGEQGAFDIETTAITYLDGKGDLMESSPLVARLNDHERRDLVAWCAHQPPNEDGAIDLMEWPGWGKVGLRWFAEIARTYKPHVYTVTQSFNDLVMAQPGSGMSHPITGRTGPESKESN